MRYATQTEQNKNQSKRKRNVTLPEDCGINPQDIPTFIWYIKAQEKHGDRWAIEIKDKYFWKTTSSKDISTKCKFELAKKHLRDLLHSRPALFTGHCLNGDLDEEAMRLKREYIDILSLAGFTFSDPYGSNYNLLAEDLTGLDEKEQEIVKNDTSKEKNQPPDMHFDLPKYCHNISATTVKGDGFCVGRLHPKQNGKDWCTTRSKKVSIQEKYNLMMEYLAKTSER